MSVVLREVMVEGGGVEEKRAWTRVNCVVEIWTRTSGWLTANLPSVRQKSCAFWTALSSVPEMSRRRLGAGL